MYKKSLAIAMSLVSATAYSQYFNDSYETMLNHNESVVELVQQYNQENGYWENDRVMNREMVRYLHHLDLSQQTDEENGYWR